MQPKYSMLSLSRGTLVSGRGPNGCPHSERSHVPPSSWQPCVVEKSGALAFSRPELKAQPTHCCGTSGKFPALSEPSVVCPRN